MSESWTLSTAWTALSSPPIVLPLALTMLGFLVTAIFAGIELINSAPPNQSSEQQTPSSTRYRGAVGSSSNGANGAGRKSSDSPESLEEGWNMRGSTNGKALKSSRKKGRAANSQNYGSVSRSQNRVGIRSASGASNDEAAEGGSTGDNTRRKVSH